MVFFNSSIEAKEFFSQLTVNTKTVKIKTLFQKFSNSVCFAKFLKLFKVCLAFSFLTCEISVVAFSSCHFMFFLTNLFLCFQSFFAAFSIVFAKLQCTYSSSILN